MVVFQAIYARVYILQVVLTLFASIFLFFCFQYINPAETFGDIVIDYAWVVVNWLPYIPINSYEFCSMRSCFCLNLLTVYSKRSWKCFGKTNGLIYVLSHRYVECTSACIQALAAFQKQYPHHRTQEIVSSILRARRYIESIQKDDGSW